MSTENRTIVVTGAAGGIGAGIVRACARAGWEVFAVDRRPPDFSNEESNSAARIHAIVADIASEAGPQEVMEEASSAGRTLGGLVNCAGVMRRGTALEISEEDWDVCFSVNVTAAFRMCRAALPAMAEGGGGAIVNIASQWGLHPAVAHVAYNASKAAMISLTQSIARDHGADGVRANAVCPGEVLTPMVEQKLQDTGTTEAELAANIPVGRLGRPQDIAEIVVYLISEKASYMSGSAIEITGGQVVA